MQLLLDRKERRSGVLRKKVEYHLVCSLRCSEAEQNILLHGLHMGEKFIVEYVHDGISWSRKVASLINNQCTFPVASLAQLQEVEEVIVESAKVLGEAVRGFVENGDSVERSEIIDL